MTDNPICEQYLKATIWKDKDHLPKGTELKVLESAVLFEFRSIQQSGSSSDFLYIFGKYIQRVHSRLGYFKRQRKEIKEYTKPIQQSHLRLLSDLRALDIDLYNKVLQNDMSSPIKPKNEVPKNFTIQKPKPKVPFIKSNYSKERVVKLYNLLISKNLIDLETKIGDFLYYFTGDKTQELPKSKIKWTGTEKADFYAFATVITPSKYHKWQLLREIIDIEYFYMTKEGFHSISRKSETSLTTPYQRCLIEYQDTLE